MEKNKKIVVTGAKGMLGTALAKKLPSRHDYSGIDIEDADITDKKNIREKLLSLRPDIVIHCAAYTNVNNSEKSTELAFSVNTLGAENTARACADCGAKIIYISTDFVFDGAKNTPYNEDDIPRPVNIYGQSKLDGEKKVRGLCANHLIVRTAWLFGPNGENFVRVILRQAAEKKKLRVVNDQRGCPAYSADFADALIILADKNITGTINVVNEGNCTWFDFAKEILSLSGVNAELSPVSSAEFASPAKRPAYSVLDTSRYQQITGHKLRPWQEALREYIEQEGV